MLQYPERPTGKYVPDEEFRKILAFVRDYLKPVVLTAYLTGMRRGELLGLTWDRVDLFKGLLTLGEEDTKTGEPRCIHFNSLPELKAVFVEAAKKRVKGQELVFIKPDGGDVPKWYISRLLKRACKDAGVGPYRLHDLRHTFNTNMSKAGVPQAVTMKLTGHKTLAMFLRYSHLDAEQAEGAMRSLGQLLFTGNGLPKKEEQEA